MKRATRTAGGPVTCVDCHGCQFTQTRTLKGIIFGGIIFAPRRLRCVGCGKVQKRPR